MSNFPYQALDRNKREIRLIVLGGPDRNNSGSSTTVSPMKCRMITTSLDLYTEPLNNYPAHQANKLRNAVTRTFLKDQPYSWDFYALSYVWGNSEDQRDLEVNGEAVKIGANLHAALLSIQQRTNFRIIWADALCINQSDNVEKSWQVQQMAALYSRARGTISWLGPSSADSDLALEALLELGSKSPNIFWSIQEAKEGGPPPRPIKTAIERIAGDEQRWNAIADLCNRPYWSRTWIFQEMACAAEKYFLCGNLMAKDIDHPISRLLAWEATQQQPSRKSLGVHCLSMVSSVQTFRFHGNFPSDAPYYVRPGTLHEMLEKLSGLEATQARDKVYAPLGIAADKDQLGIVPDYSKPLDQIFKETACALLRQGGLEVLCSAASQESRKLQLPSWVPDWSGNLSAGPGRLYRADKGVSQRQSTLEAIPQTSDHITIDGYLVGREAAGPGETPFADWLRGFETTLFSDQRGVDGGSRIENSSSGYKIAELLSAEPGPRPAWSLLPNPYIRVYKKIIGARSLKSVTMDLAKDVSKKKDLFLVESIKRIHHILETGSRPYRTDSGAVGLTSKDKDMVGDLIVIIPGVSMPCVLRRMATAGATPAAQSIDRYQLVGVTYVHDVMQGEFFKRKALVPQSFTIY